jgi:hypothetical protein
MAATSNESFLAELLQADGDSNVPTQRERYALALEQMQIDLMALATQAVEWAAGGGGRDATEAPAWKRLNGVRMSKPWEARTKTQVPAARAFSAREFSPAQLPCHNNQCDYRYTIPGPPPTAATSQTSLRTCQLTAQCRCILHLCSFCSRSPPLPPHP